MCRHLPENSFPYTLKVYHIPIMRDKDISFHKSKSGIPLEKAAEAAFPLIIFNAEFVFDHGCDIINDSFELVDFFPFAHDAD